MSKVDDLLELIRGNPAGEELATILADFLASDEGELLLRAKLAEALKEIATQETDVHLTSAEEEVVRLALNGPPITASDLAERASGEFKTLRHRSAASAILSDLASKGVVGKIELGREVRYTHPREAVVQALIVRGELPNECSPDEIVAITGLPMMQVLQTLRDLA